MGMFGGNLGFRFKQYFENKSCLGFSIGTLLCLYLFIYSNFLTVIRFLAMFGC